LDYFFSAYASALVFVLIVLTSISYLSKVTTMRYRHPMAREMYSAAGAGSLQLLAVLLQHR
jgi:hypothetical protein